jgi:hypothetical protein
MKMPPANSRQRKITSLLLDGACISPQEGIALHGTMRLTLAEIAELYQDLVVRGCAVQVGPRIEASPALLDRYGPVDPPAAPTGPKVLPAERPPFRPLSSSHIPSSRGRREGSNDLRDLPSHYAQLGTNTGGGA